MTDSIDLDDLDIEEESPDEDAPNRGDWFWREEGDPTAEPSLDDPETEDGTAAAEADGDADGDADEDGPTTPTQAGIDATDPEAPTPRVPRADDDRPVGIPKAGGGAGGATAGDQPTERAEREASAESTAGPHGGGVDDMTTAFTLSALQRLENLHVALADTNEWSDWIGIVGDVGAPVINKFQREHGVDADFFNGTGTGPGERLAEIDRHSMFYAERMVVVGCEGEEWIAEAADWEFVPIEKAAEKSGWSLTR